MVTTTIVQTGANHPVPCRTAAPLPFAAAVFSVQPPRWVFFHLQTRPRSTAAVVSRVRRAALPPRHLHGQGWPPHFRDVARQLLMSWPRSPLHRGHGRVPFFQLQLWPHVRSWLPLSAGVISLSSMAALTAASQACPHFAPN
ncbi:phosphoadenosine phosphosulfate reductase [Sesbania bispinosa]|nr:phosphoadenosine phosphosulfate reductase [Sesbania bispinosa]